MKHILWFCLFFASISHSGSDIALPEQHQSKNTYVKFRLQQVNNISEKQLLSALQSKDWKLRTQAKIIKLHQQSERKSTAILTAEPSLSRSKKAQFIADEQSGPLLAERFMYYGEDDFIREGLATALSNYWTDYYEALPSLYRQEESPVIRSALISSLRRKPDIHRALLQQSLASNDASERATAAALMGYHNHPDIPALINTLDDSNDDVVAMAIRSLAWKNEKSCIDKLSQLLLQSENRQLRIQAFSALRRLDRAYLQNLIRSQQLTHDQDTKIAELAIFETH